MHVWKFLPVSLRIHFFIVFLVIAFAPQSFGQMRVDGKSSSQTQSGRTELVTTGPFSQLGLSASLEPLSPAVEPVMYSPLGESTISSNFNGTAISAGNYIWFNSVFTVSGLGSTPATLVVRNSTIHFAANGQNYDVPLPDSVITISTSNTTATTSFANGSWMTSLPASGLSGNKFLNGGAFPVPVGGLPGGIGPVTWTATLYSSTPSASVNWKWSAAVYKSFSSDLSTLGVKPVDDNSGSAYHNSDHAGTPEAFKGYVTGGAKGGGGSNYTGGYSGTDSTSPSSDSSQPVITASLSPLPNAAGWNNTQVVVSFACSDSGSGIANCPSPITVTQEASGQVISGTATDRFGITASASVTVNIDKTLPNATVSYSSTPAGTWYSGSTTITFACQDSLSGVVACPQPITVTGDGANQQFTRTVLDVAGNSKSITASVSIDQTAPAITATQTPLPNPNGWNNSDVTVSFQCADTGSGVLNCPQPVVVAAETAGQLVNGTAADNAGNQSTAGLTIKLDRQPPTIVGVVTPASNDAGWNRTDVEVSYQCTDALSGVAACPNGSLMTQEGTQVLPSVSASDNAGNSGSTSLTVRIDKTPPTITADITPAPDAHGVNPSDPTITFHCSDSGSGIKACPDPIVVTTEGTGQSFTGTAVDLAGNTRLTEVTINLVKSSPPSIIYQLSPAANANSWNRSDVTVSFACASPGSTITGCGPDRIISAEGVNQQITGVAIDANGSSSSVSVVVNIDKSVPQITAAIVPQPNGQGWVIGPASVLFSCSDAISGVATCPSGVDLATEGANLPVSGTATDLAGNSATSSVSVNVETNPPTITASASPQPNASGWNNSDVTVSFTCAASISGGVTCPSAETIATEGANQSASATTTDNAGLSAQATASANIDKTPPTLVITSPASGVKLSQSALSIYGSASDSLSGIKSATCNGQEIGLPEGVFRCDVQLSAGTNSIGIEVRDVAGNTAQQTVNISYVVPPVVTIVSPVAFSLFGSNPVTVTGSVDTPNATVTVNGVDAIVNGGSFTASGINLREGQTLVTATAITPEGGVGTATVDLLLDTVPPVVRIDAPAAGSTLASSEITVSGTVNDIVTGTVNSEEASVTVNGIPAQVSNRSFEARGVLLTPGVNVISAVAKDRAGHTAETKISVTVSDATYQGKLVAVSGDGQSAAVNTQLAEPVVVKIVDANGMPIAGRAITFTVIRTDGVIRAYPDEGRQLTLASGADGTASVLWQIGSRSGVANNQLNVSAVGVTGDLIFTASGTVAPAAAITTATGDTQGGQLHGITGAALPYPLVATVFDAKGNPVAGVPVTFTVQKGGGTIEGTLSVTKSTNSDGRVALVPVLGSEVGTNNNVITASFPNMKCAPAVFLISGVLGGPAEATSVSGIVLDNSNNPIPNARVSVSPSKLEGPTLSANTDENGRFLISGAPVGTVQLFVDGSTSSRPETFPTLQFQLNDVAGAENSLGVPIYLPFVDSANSKVVGGDEEQVLTAKDLPGVAFTVAPHSATFPDGSHVGRLSVTQVHSDKVPMPPPNGGAPRLVFTLQPPNVRFDPPIKIQIPNTDGLPAGKAVEYFQFDHDLEQWTSVGLVRVVPDGSVLVSDLGFGVTKTGWGGPSNNQQTTCANGCDNGCLVNPKCVNGQCAGDPKEISDLNAGALDGNGVRQLYQARLAEDATLRFEAETTSKGCDEVHYEWNFGDAASGESNKSTAQKPSHSFSNKGIYDVTVTAKCDTCEHTKTAHVKVAVFSAKLTKVSWTGTGEIQLWKKSGKEWNTLRLSEAGDIQIKDPVWISDGNSITTEPVAYVIGSSPQLSAVLTFDPPLPNSSTVELKVASPDNSAEFEKNLAIGSSTIAVPGISFDNPFTGEIASSTLSLQWSFSFDGGNTYTEFDSSDQLIFTLPGAPVFGGTVGDKQAADFSLEPLNPSDVTATRVRNAVETIFAGAPASNPKVLGSTAQNYFMDTLGFTLANSCIDKPWTAFDLPPAGQPGSGVDCSSLSAITALNLKLIGIRAWVGLAYPIPPGTFDASHKHFKNGHQLIFGDGSETNQNVYEGFVYIETGSTYVGYPGGTRSNVSPTQLPSGNKLDGLFYSVIAFFVGEGQPDYQYYEGDMSTQVPFPKP